MNHEQVVRKNNGLLEFIFFSNYFYGICAVALSVEATLQQRFSLNAPWFYFLLFITTVLYYAYPYIRKTTGESANPRTNWYTQNYKLMVWNQVIITIILALSLILILWFYGRSLLNMQPLEWVMIFIFPIVAALYYGLESSPGNNLRKIGWLKPFIIGFTWAGMVNIYPVLFYCIVHKIHFIPGQINILLFIKNLMYITVLCILFDIKDYNVDYLSRVKTFVVRVGLRNTIFYIVLPLSVIGLVTFVYYAETHQFSNMRILLNVIPFVSLLIGAWSLRKRRSLLYYLSVIDGLMLVKAVCGIIAVSYF